MKQKRAIGALVFGGALIIGAVVLDMRTQTILPQAAAIVTTTERVPRTTEDTDNDGIPDWEERILGTDIMTPNERPSTTPTLSSAVDTEPIPDTATTRLAHSLFGNYLSKRLSSGEMLSPEEQQRVAREATRYVEKYVEDKPLTLTDIYVTPTNDEISLYTYGNKVGQALQKYPDSPENELLILKRAIDSNNEEELKALDSKITAYKASVDEMRVIPVPSDMQGQHLALLNALIGLHNTIYTMRQAFEDPVAALVRSRNYFTQTEELGKAIRGITETLAQKGVVYGESDPGMFLLSLAKMVE